ncbi:MAG: alpha/beta hydrolase [Clostridiales bacterium]|nr:alpha/beta hydrolase [Clostridiales bacterium]
MQEKRFETDKGSIAYWVGAGKMNRPWLVFLPGLSADHTLFERQTAYFAERYNCLVWDAPAHGCSRPFELTFSMRDMAAYLHGILEAEGIVNPVLIGQSLGGYVAQSYMDLYPGSARAFVSIDSCSLSRKYYSAWELWLLKRTGWMYLSIPWKLLLKWGVRGTATTAYGRTLMEKMWSVYERKEYCALADHGMRIFAQAVESREEYPIECPVLLLCGDQDAAGSAKRYNRRWTKEDGHRLVWIHGAGHNANTDAPEQVNSLIEAFVESL